MSAPRPRDVLSDAESQCASSSNTNTSCYPASLTAFVQGQNASFIWNPALSQFQRTNRVNITIYDGSAEWDGSISDQNTILRYTNIANPASGAGVLQVPVNDSWWGAKGAIWVGNVSYPFLWTIWGVDEQDTFTIGRQPMFAAIQTTLPDSVRATMAPTPTPSSVSAGSITGSITSLPSPSITTGGGSHSAGSSNRTAIIAGVVCSVLGVVLIVSVFFLIRRRRLARTPPPNYIPDPILNLGVYEKQPLRTMRTAHERLLALQHELLAQPQPGSDIPAGSQNENAELRARIQLLTEEVERLRSMGAEAPPAYSIQEG
ncbi:hypothetical protein B0H14DRAFT_3031109 [Mycena olivaceomarginata]|nr:hypothetical protein B0H14DRAFT_3031109 [Mycena olivaceomarginata]